MGMQTARRALTESALALGLACAAIGALLPSWQAALAASPWRAGAAALAVAIALPLHWLMLAAGLRRLGLPRRGWLGMAVLLFPVGGAAALILLLGLPGAQGRTGTQAWPAR